MAAVNLDTSTISVLSKEISNRTISPVEIVEATLQRIEQLQPILLSFTTPTPEYAIERALKAEKEISQGKYRGPLHGIPYTLKDVIATKGIRTTFGNPKGTDYKPTEDATLHTLLEQAGAILVGKVVSEIGRDNTGPVGCRNAWDPTMSPGTSSSGSGSATAASMGLLSIGTDTGGSVRHPGSNSNLVAMRATFGRISRFGVFHSSWSHDQAGPLTKTVSDNAIALSVLGKYDPMDPISIPEPPYDYLENLGNSIKGVRIGVPKDDWVWKDWLSEEEESVVRAAIEVLKELGASIKEIDLPLGGRSRNEGMATSAEAPVYIYDHFSQEQIDDWPEMKPRADEGLNQPAEDYIRAQYLRARIRQEAIAALNEVDVIAMPTGSTFGDKWDASTSIIRGREVSARSRAVYRNGFASVTGTPAVSIPCGFGLNDTFPIGLMLQGRPMEETLLYQVGYAYEQTTEWHLRHPNLPVGA